MLSINENNIEKASVAACNFRYNLENEDQLKKILNNAIYILYLQFSTTKASSRGMARLTASSTLIGEHTNHELGIYNRSAQAGVSWVSNIKTGDLIMEALMQCGYIDIKFTRYDPLEQAESYCIYWTKKWMDISYVPPMSTLVRGTVFEKPDDISILEQHITCNSIIKRYTGSTEDFTKLLDKPFMKSGNKLQQTNWSINHRIYDAIRKRIRSLLKPLPNHKEDELLYLSTFSKNFEVKQILLMAEQFANRGFYQLVEFDYRGRVYYAEPFLNFQGSDTSRGLMQFAKGKKLDSGGRWWLAVHTANSFNQSYKIDEIPEWCTADYKTYLKSEGLDNIAVDKMTLDDRAEWTNQNKEMILKYAREDIIDELAEKPVIFLACCVEWEGVHNDPEWISHLPVSVDGSNNGWQHLGAISKDKLTGELVGLVPVEIQRDFYVSTAKELISRVPEWFESRQMPMKSIRKGISKRGSMTRAYSAGAEKIGINMFADCMQAGYDKKYNISRDDCMMLAKNLIKAIDVVCPGPLQTMKYLQNVAGALLDDGNKAIEWISPSGFPIVYKRDIQKKVKCRSIINGLKKGNNKNHKHCHMIPIKGRPDRKSFMSGISPNYIHSMDASHMAKVINEWYGDFGAVHDSFSCHASDVEDLVHLTKEKFIEMYDHEDYFVKIDETFKMHRVSGPPLGTLDIEDIHNSDYLFC